MDEAALPSALYFVVYMHASYLSISQYDRNLPGQCSRCVKQSGLLPRSFFLFVTKVTQNTSYIVQVHEQIICHG